MPTDARIPDMFLRLALATSRLVSLFRDAGLSFDHHDNRMLDLGCTTLDELEQILHDTNGMIVIDERTPRALRLEWFAQACAGDRRLPPDVREGACNALGIVSFDPNEVRITAEDAKRILAALTKDPVVLLHRQA